jgi:hypothetical protein
MKQFTGGVFMVRLVTAVLVVLVLFTAIAIGEDDPKTVKSDVPQAVLRAFEKANPGVVGTDYSKEVVNGQTRYEIETRVSDLEKDFVYLPDGTLLQIVEDMQLKALPDVIAQSVKKAYPKAEIDEVDKIVRGETVEYEIILEIGETDHELSVASDGRILSSVAIEEDEDEPDDIDQSDEEDGE